VFALTEGPGLAALDPAALIAIVRSAWRFDCSIVRWFSTAPG